MYERYQQDPASVDKAWWDFFADFKGAGESSTNQVNQQNQRGVPPIPKSQQVAQQPICYRG